MMKNDVGIVFVRKNGTTYTRWYYDEINKARVIPYSITLEEFTSKQSLRLFKFYHQAFSDDRPFAVVRGKKCLK